MKTKDYFEQFVFYDETSPTCLRRVCDSYSGRYNRILKAKAGDVAGYKTARNYYRVTINGKRYLAHRVIAVLHGYSVDGLVIDHLDGNGLNNRIENLRVTTQLENCRNSKARKSNKSGIPGVHWCKIHNCYVYQWIEDGKRMSHKFRYKEDESYEEIVERILSFKQEVITRLQSKGVIFTSRHHK